MDLATLIIKTQDAKSHKERTALRKKYNETVRNLNEEHLNEVKSQIQQNMNFSIESNADEMLLGVYLCNGETDFGEEITVLSFGLIFITFNITFNLQVMMGEESLFELREIVFEWNIITGYNYYTGYWIKLPTN